MKTLFSIFALSSLLASSADLIITNISFQATVQWETTVPGPYSVLLSTGGAWQPWKVVTDTNAATAPISGPVGQFYVVACPSNPPAATSITATPHSKTAVFVTFPGVRDCLTGTNCFGYRVRAYDTNNVMLREFGYFAFDLESTVTPMILVSRLPFPGTTYIITMSAIDTIWRYGEPFSIHAMTAP